MSTKIVTKSSILAAAIAAALMIAPAGALATEGGSSQNAAPAAALATVNWEIPLKAGPAYPRATGAAQYQSQPGQKELQVEVEQERPLLLPARERRREVGGNDRLPRPALRREDRDDAAAVHRRLELAACVCRLADREHDVVRELRQQQHVGDVGGERVLEHRRGLRSGGDEDDRRPGLLADRGYLAGGELGRARGVEHAVEVPAGERGRGLGDVHAGSDDVDLLDVGERAAEGVEAVAGPGEIHTDGVAHFAIPAVRIESAVSTRSRLSVAPSAGRSSSVQSAFFMT